MYKLLNENQKEEIIQYIDKIRKKMPLWKKGGKIKLDITKEKVGRNELCPCGSGQKYKQCHGK
ncbi:MAG: SEC-C domain-containing protein [Clostridia bacterium]|nr:SEC-C domain-containing protein [Clostridia bacterium]